MLAKVVESAPGRLTAVIGEGTDAKRVTVEQRFYNNVDHGYATTVHKSQGATVDRVKVLASLSLDRHLTYVAMTRHREDLGVYYGSRSFAKAGGLVELLSRKNSKETTLDYAGGTLYRQALRFAEARGLHLVNVARTVARDQLEWTVRQKQRLVDLASRLAAIGARIGLSSSQLHSSSQSFSPATAKDAKPMVAGITTFPKSIDQAVEDKLSADPGLKKQWDDVSTRFHLVYANPQSAFKAVNVDAMLADTPTAANTLFKVANEPESFGALKGKTGIFAGKADKQDRDTAILNVPALARNLEQYLRPAPRPSTSTRPRARVRAKLSIDIPALSANAKTVLERVRDAIDRNDLPSGLEYALADKMVKAELEGFARAVSERFGERTFLGIAAKSNDGEPFRRVTANMAPGQTAEVKAAWEQLRTVQQLSAHERTVTALKEAETLRQAKSQGLTLK